MKLRIKGDSLRLRLTRGEVERFASTGELTETMHLPGACLTYALRSDAGGRGMSARLQGSGLTVILPGEMALRWAGSDQVSLSGRDGPLHILVEKDFACLKPREGEDDSDAYPHPEQIAGEPEK